MFRLSRCGSVAAGSRRLKILSQHNEVLVPVANRTAVSHPGNNLYLEAKIVRYASKLEIDALFEILIIVLHEFILLAIGG
jgi:hypothetical protein